MEVKQGYKQTDIGIIPSDWAVTNIINNSTLKARIGWQGLTTAEYLENGNYILITGTDFNDGEITWDTCHYVSKDRYDQDKNIQIKDDDILITKDGTIGKVAFIKNLPLPATLNSGVFVVRPKNGSYIPHYMFYIFYSIFFNEFLRKLVAGSTINHLYQKDFVSFRFPLPPTKAEQTAIAQVLRDTEELISSLEKLIEKKKQIKQATMQQLLTGKKRLPGFSGKWVKMKIGDVGRCLRGVSYKPETDLFPYDTGYSIRLLRAHNINESKIMKSDLQFVHRRKVKEIQKLMSFDIIICMASGSKELVGKSAFFRDADNFEYTFGAFMGCFRTNSEIANPLFVFHFFQSNNFRNYIDVLLSGSSINNLRPSDIESIENYFPLTEEQIAISNIIGEMDTEIESLEEKLNKYKSIKQGMMQNLLTGKIRLV